VAGVWLEFGSSSKTTALRGRCDKENCHGAGSIGSSSKTTALRGRCDKENCHGAGSIGSSSKTTALRGRCDKNCHGARSICFSIF